MIHLQVNTDADGAWPDIDPDATIVCKRDRIARVPMGTANGKSTVAVLLELPDGRRVYAEQSLSNLRCAMAAFEGAELADAGQRAGHQQ